MEFCSVCGKATENLLKPGEVVVLGLGADHVAIQVGVSRMDGGAVCPKCVERMVRDDLMNSVMQLREEREVMA